MCDPSSTARLISVNLRVKDYQLPSFHVKGAVFTTEDY